MCSVCMCVRAYMCVQYVYMCVYMCVYVYVCAVCVYVCMCVCVYPQPHIQNVSKDYEVTRVRKV